MAKPYLGEKNLGPRLKAATKLLLSIGVLAMGVEALDGCGYIDSPVVPVKKAKAEATNQYDSQFQHASPVGKFALDYLRVTPISVYRDTFNDGAGWHYKDYYEFDFGDACLASSAYNIAGGSVHASADGLMSHAQVDANTPADAQAYVSSTHPNQLVITASGTDIKRLTFNGVESGLELVPANQQTQDVLSTYGCQPGHVTEAY
ncbi:MAG TPA: hypothetical protein VMU97_00940 [Candidatus Dormibacteraeota bacterium]|nr:hypothetical protein [Candidatus Dormibacteraeota bacterium]